MYLRKLRGKIVNSVKVNPEFAALCDELKKYRPRTEWVEVKQLIDHIYAEFDMEHITPEESELIRWVLFELKMRADYIQDFDFNNDTFEQMSPGFYADFILWKGYSAAKEMVASLSVEAAL